MMAFLYALAAIALSLAVLVYLLEESLGRKIHRNSQSRLPSSKVPPSGPTTHGEDTTRAAVGEPNNQGTEAGQ